MHTGWTIHRECLNLNSVKKISRHINFIDFEGSCQECVYGQVGAELPNATIVILGERVRAQAQDHNTVC